MKEIVLPELSGGLNKRDPEYSINDNQSPDLLNVWFKNKALSKRPGQEVVTSLPDVYAISNEFHGYRIVHAGTKLYMWDGETATAIIPSMYNIIQNQTGVFIDVGDFVYYMDGASIFKLYFYDFLGTIQVELLANATSGYGYTPIVIINAAPNLSTRTDNESYNLISPRFTTKYNGNASSTTYQLPQTALDSEVVVVTINGNVLTAPDTTDGEGYYFSVNRTNGTVNFAGGTHPYGAPPSGTNNVWITAAKTINGNRAKIANCKTFLIFGGERAGVYGGTRVFAMANPDTPLSYYSSELLTSHGIGYWPDTGEEYLDQNNEPITAAAKMGASMIVFKSHSIFAFSYSFDGENIFYPVEEIHASRGCDMPGSIQLIDNALVFAHSVDGIQILTSINRTKETNVKPISANINDLLLTESDLQNACSADYDQYYWLCVNGHVYLWDYGSTPFYNYSDYDKAQRRLAWYYWNGIAAKTFFEMNGLCFGGEVGLSKLTEDMSDNGEAYDCHFITKAFNMGDPSMLKTVFNVYPSLATNRAIEVTVTLSSEKISAFKEKTFIVNPSFTWTAFDWTRFAWDSTRLTKDYRFRANLKKCRYLQIKFTANDANKDLGVSGIRAEYENLSKTKGTR